AARCGWRRMGKERRGARGRRRWREKEIRRRQMKRRSNFRAAVRVHLLRCRSRSHRLSRSERRACAEWPEWPEFSCDAPRSVQHLLRIWTGLVGCSRSVVRALAPRRPAPEAVSDYSEFSSALSQNRPTRSSLLSNEPIARILSEAETCDACYWPWRLLPARSAG